MVSLGSLKILFLFVATVLIFCTAGLLSLVLRARRLLGAYRIPWRPAFSSHLINARHRKLNDCPTGRYSVGCGPFGFSDCQEKQQTELPHSKKFSLSG